MQTTDLTDTQIANEMEVDETLVSAIRQTILKIKNRCSLLFY
jgi:hypothetical protein